MGRIFNKYADWETGLFGSEERRRWFDLEGFKLLEQLQKEAGDHFISNYIYGSDLMYLFAPFRSVGETAPEFPSAWPD